MLGFLLGLIIGSTIGLVLTAMLYISGDSERMPVLRSTCCNAPVRKIVDHKCTECGKFCGVRI